VHDDFINNPCGCFGCTSC